jgi:hypothetical protein
MVVYLRLGCSQSGIDSLLWSDAEIDRRDDSIVGPGVPTIACLSLSSTVFAAALANKTTNEMVAGECGVGGSGQALFSQNQ